MCNNDIKDVQYSKQLSKPWSENYEYQFSAWSKKTHVAVIVR